jgi:DNA-binding transcriptional MocR family regulator
LGARHGDHRRPAPLAADDPDGHVVLLRSLTKVAAPGLRIAMVAARGAAGARLRAMRHVDDFFVSGPLQQAALELVSAPAWRRHLKHLSGALRERRDALAAAVTRDLPDLRLAPLPDGGLHLWGQLPDHVDDVRLAAEAAGAGVVVFPGTPFFAADAPGSFLRLTFGATEPADLAEGVRRLAGVLPSRASS